MTHNETAAPRPIAPLCELCQRARRYCRGLCQACYRKLRAEGIDLRPSRQGERPYLTLGDLMERAAARLTPEDRARLRAKLAALENVG